MLCRVIVEVVGNPKEHVEATLKNYVKKAKEDDNGVEVIDEHYEPAEKQEKTGLWSAFSEIEIKVKSPSVLVAFCIDYMPSSIEVLEPETFHFKANEFSNFFNDLQAKLHVYDLTIKEDKAANIILNKNFLNLLRNTLVLSLANGAKTAEELEKEVGIKAEKFMPYVQEYVKKGLVELVDGKYKLKKK